MSGQILTHCTSAIEDLTKYKEAISQYLIAGSVDEFIQLLRDSIKFKLPDGGRLIDVSPGADIRSEFAKHQLECRLPYPLIALEYEMKDVHFGDSGYTGEQLKFDKTITVAKECEDGNIIVIVFARCQFEQLGWVWHPVNFGACLNAQGVSITPITTFGRTLSQNQYAADNDIAGEVGILCCFLLALGCSNTQMESIEAPTQLNKKREERGRVPFFSYKVLTIPGSNKSSADLGGTHASPRVHLRRGHIRRLKDKSIWINSMVVGNKSKGMIHKDYEVKV